MVSIRTIHFCNHNGPWTRDTTLGYVVKPGSELAGPGSVWLIAFGKGVRAKGEVTTKEQLFSNQIAPTIFQLLGLQGDDIKMPGAALDFK